MIDTRSHHTVFEAYKERNTNVTIVGCGGGGSRKAVLLAQLGFQNFTLIDQDIVESHNLGNQHFYERHIGLPKTEALASILQELDNGINVTIHDTFIEQGKPQKDLFKGLIILSVDSMKARKYIGLENIKGNINVEFVVDSRSGAHEGRIMTFSPRKPRTMQFWENTLYDDLDEGSISDAQRASQENRTCRVIPTIGSTLALNSSYAIWEVIKYYGIKNNTPFIKEHTPAYTQGYMFTEVFFGILPNAYLEYHPITA